MHFPQLRAALQNRLAPVKIRSSYRCAATPPAPCNTVQGKMQSLLLSAALQGKLAAGLYHFNFTNEDWLLILVCTDPPAVHCNTVQGKM